jgi:hypothetical protein
LKGALAGPPCALRPFDVPHAHAADRTALRLAHRSLPDRSVTSGRAPSVLRPRARKSRDDDWRQCLRGYRAGRRRETRGDVQTFGWSCSRESFRRRGHCSDLNPLCCRGRRERTSRQPRWAEAGIHFVAVDHPRRPVQTNCLHRNDVPASKRRRLRAPATQDSPRARARAGRRDGCARRG